MPKYNSFGKHERLCSQKLIQQIFAEGEKLYRFPYRLLYLLTEKEKQTSARIVISVPKRIFKKAVERNLIKRRIREAYRIHKREFYLKLSLPYTINIMLIYVSPNIMSYAEIEKKLEQTLEQLAKHIEKNSNIPLHIVN